MKRLINTSIFFLALTLLSTAVFAQSNSNGNKGVKQFNQGQNGVKLNWVDANGDGICDNFGTENQGQGKANKNTKLNKRNGNSTGLGLGNGFGDGSGIRPQDGTGFGRGNGTGSGSCDGTGPKGKSTRNGNRK